MQENASCAQTVPGERATHRALRPGAPSPRSMFDDRTPRGGPRSRAVRRLVELCDITRPITARCEIAAAFSHEVDTVFARGAGIPRGQMRRLVGLYDWILHEELVPGLAARGVTFPAWHDLSSLERVQFHRRFRERVFPLLSPMAVDSTHPLPHLASLAVNVALRADGRLVVVTMSPHVPRLLSIRRDQFVRAESFASGLLPELLVGVRICDVVAFRITRSPFAAHPVRLEVDRGASPAIVEALTARLGVTEADVYRVRSSLGLGDVFASCADPAVVPARSGHALGGYRRTESMR